MKNLNLVRCSASIDASGNVVVGTAQSGCRAYTELAAGTSVDGTYSYMLSNASGQWEAGTITVNGSAAPRTMRSHSADLPVQFPANTVGLTLTCPVLAEGSVTIAQGSRPSVVGLQYGIAAGSTAQAFGDNSMALGSGACAADVAATAIGPGALAQMQGEFAVSLGSNTHSRIVRASGFVNSGSPSDPLRLITDSTPFAPRTAYGANTQEGLLMVRADIVISNANTGVPSASNCWALTVDYAVYITVPVSTPVSTTLYTNITTLAKVGTFTGINLAVNSDGGLTLSGGSGSVTAQAVAFIRTLDTSTTTADYQGFTNIGVPAGV